MFYFRYVDDIITCIAIERIDKILSIFNSYDVRLQFKREIENENKISFLERIDTDWYTKPTFSGRFLSFEFLHPLPQMYT